MADPQIRSLARRLASLERARLQTKQPNLGFSTIDGGAIQAQDEDGNLTMIVGRQFDGTNSSTVVSGPTPPTPTVPLLTPGIGVLRIYWDGTFADGASAPLDFTRVLAYAVPLASYVGPDPLDQTVIVGQFTSATGGEITAALEPGVEYAVYLVTWTEPGKYSAASDVATATPAEAPSGGGAATDGQPPASSPTVTLTPGIGVFYAKWDPVANADPVTYDVHVSDVDPMPVDSTTLVGSVSGTMAVIKSTTDGAALDPEKEYRVVLVARDADGAAAPGTASAPSRVRLVTGPDIAANAVTTRELVAGAVTTENLDANAIDGMVVTGATVRTAESGRRVVMDDQGFRLIGADDRTLVNLPNDPSLPARFEGDAHIHNLTVDDFTTLQQSELAEAATFTMQSSVRPPSSAPTIDPNQYETFQMYDTADLPWSQRWGTALNPNNINQIFTLNMYGNEEVGLERINLTTGNREAILARISGHRGPIKTYNIAASDIYIFVIYYDSYIGSWFLNVYNHSGSWLAQHDWTAPSGTKTPAMFWRASDSRLLIAQTLSSGTNAGKVRIQQYGVTTGAMTYWGYYDTSTVYDYNLASLAYGSFDLGSDHYMITARWGPQQAHFFGPTGTAAPDHDFSSGIGQMNKAGMWWDGNYFYSIDANGLRRLYEGGNKWVGGYTKDIEIGYTWYKSTATVAETTIGPVSTATIEKRSRLKYTTLPIPGGGPDNLRIYAREKPAAGTVETGAYGNKYALNLTTTATTGYLNSLVLSPGNDPIENTFGLGIPSKFRSAAVRADGYPKIELGGDGSARVDGLVPPGSMMMFAGPNAPAGWLLCHGQNVSISSYPDLYNTIGHAFNNGVSPGSGLFKLPDLRMRLPIGADPTTIFSLGQDDGRTSMYSRSDSHSHSHKHSTPNTVDNAGAHSHGSGTLDISTPTGGVTRGNGTMDTAGPSHKHSITGSTATSGNHNHALPDTNNAIGIGNTETSAHSWTALHYIIKF